MVDHSGRATLRSRLADAESGIILFGITPPRLSTTPERIREITAATLARLDALNVDGLALYDIDDESDRNPEERPFPYLPTLDPATYHAEYLAAWSRPAVVYRCVGKYTEAEMSTWLRTADPDRTLGVFVGASSKAKSVHIRLPEAHALHGDVRSDLLLGGVAITERPDEHLRLIAKQQAGCTYFISQVIYSADAAKSMVSDYFYACRDHGSNRGPCSSRSRYAARRRRWRSSNGSESMSHAGSRTLCCTLTTRSPSPTSTAWRMPAT